MTFNFINRALFGIYFTMHNFHINPERKHTGWII